MRPSPWVALDACIRRRSAADTAWQNLQLEAVSSTFSLTTQQGWCYA
jgi:hypothetical protein